MSLQTGIEWTDATWNPIRGCSRVSEGCRNCYAERVASRFSDEGQAYHGLARRRSNGEPQWTGEVIVVERHLYDPLRWKEPRKIFVNSMSDLFHEQLVIDDIAHIFAVMAIARQHTFQVLTKRAKAMQEVLSDPEWLDVLKAHVLEVALTQAPETKGGYTWPLPNVWLGVSVENQAAADERIPLLLDTPAAVRFLSCEPLLGAVDLLAASAIAPPDLKDFCAPGQKLCADPLCRRRGNHFAYEFGCRWSKVDNGGAPGQIDWVIVGGESGPHARPMVREWATSLRDQCVAAGVAFFFKQWGEYQPTRFIPGESLHLPLLGPAERVYALPERGGWQVLDRVGKKRAGRELEGRTWDEFPRVERV